MPSSLHGPLKHWQTPAMVPSVHGIQWLEWSTVGDWRPRTFHWFWWKVHQVHPNHIQIIDLFSSLLKADCERNTIHFWGTNKCCWPWRKLRCISFCVYTKLRILWTLKLKHSQNLNFLVPLPSFMANALDPTHCVLPRLALQPRPVLCMDMGCRVQRVEPLWAYATYIYIHIFYT